MLNDYIVDINQWFALECRKRFKPINQANGFAILITQYRESVRNAGKRCGEVICDFSGQGYAAAHWILCIMVEQVANGGGMIGIVVVSNYNVKDHSVNTHSTNICPDFPETSSPHRT